MSRGAALALLALLAACAPETPVDQACDAAVENDPAVKLLTEKGSGNLFFLFGSFEELKAAKQKARLACLRNRGLLPPGGVERQKPTT